jgi:hypothetical protein
MNSTGTLTDPFAIDAVTVHLLDPVTGQSLFPQTDDPAGGGDPFFYFFYQDTNGDVTQPSSFLGRQQDVLTLSFPALASPTDALLRFQLLSADNGLDTQVAIDDVALSVIPEPLTLAGVAISLGALANYFRRRKRDR